MLLTNVLTILGDAKMPGTVTTTEPVDHLTEEEVSREIELRIKAGAIRSWTETMAGVQTLFTEWNIIGEQ